MKGRSDNPANRTSNSFEPSNKNQPIPQEYKPSTWTYNPKSDTSPNKTNNFEEKHQTSHPSTNPYSNTNTNSQQSANK